jgi:hydrogenase maturation factor
MPSSVPSKSKEPSTLSSAVPSRSFRVQRAVELAFVDAIGVKLLFESSEPWCMPSYVPSKSREPSTLPSAGPLTSSEPSSACSIGCTIRVQQAVELDLFVHAIRGKYTVVHAILCANKVNRAFDVAICYSAFEVNGAIGCSIGCASESEPSNLPSSTKSDSSLPSSRPSSVPSKLCKPPMFPCALPSKKSEPSYVPSAVPSESNEPWSLPLSESSEPSSTPSSVPSK